MFGRRLCSFRDDAQSSSSWDYCSPPGEVGLISLSDCMYGTYVRGCRCSQVGLASVGVGLRVPHSGSKNSAPHM